MLTQVASREGLEKKASFKAYYAILSILALGSIAGLVGVYWDIAWHIDIGRDGFFSPPHTFIYASMFIILVLSVVVLLSDRRQSYLHIKIGALRLQPGMLAVALGAALELFFAPADDMWHRFFGADVTLWAPMHLIGLSALSLATFGALISSRVEYLLSSSPQDKRIYRLATLFFAALLLGYSMLFLAEYEFNVPAFPMYLHVALLSALPTFVLVLIAALRPFAFSATATALIFSVFRMLLALWLMIADSRFHWGGESMPVIPMLLFTAFVADILLRPRFHMWFVGLVMAIVTFLSNWFFIELFTSINWYENARLGGLVLGIVLSMAFAYLALWVAEAMLGRKRVKPMLFSLEAKAKS